MKPGALFCSAKLALRAAADASCELRFWLLRPANLVTEDCGVFRYQYSHHSISKGLWVMIESNQERSVTA